MATNAWRVKSAVIALTDRTAFLRPYQKMSGEAYTSVLRSWIHCRIFWVEYLELCYLLYLSMWENLLNISIVQYHTDLLICFLVWNCFKFRTCNNSSCLITVLFQKYLRFKTKMFLLFYIKPKEVPNFLSKSRYW